MATGQPDIEPDIEIEYWELDDGSVGGRIGAAPEGDIWAESEGALIKGIGHIMESIGSVEKAARASGDTTSMRMLTGLDAQGMWIDGRYTVRFLAVKGFGVTFDTEDGLVTWLGTVVRLVVGLFAPNALPMSVIAHEDDLPHLASQPTRAHRRQRRGAKRSSRSSLN